MNNFANKQPSRPEEGSRDLRNANELETVYPYPDIPRSVRKHLERCFEIDDINHVNPDDAREQTRLERLNNINQVLGLVRTYCGTELNGSAYKAAALGVVVDIAEGLGNNRSPSTRASEVLANFFDQNAEEGDLMTPKNVYIAGLLQDRRRLDRFREESRSSNDALDYEAGAALPSKAEWLSDPAASDSDTLYDLASTINIESILISGAEIIQKLNSSSSNDRETLDLIRYSERIVAPVAELIGFDTLAMSLNSLTKSTRLVNGGRGYLLHRADAIIDRFRAFDRGHSLGNNVRTIFSNIMDEIFTADGNIAEPQLAVNYGDMCQSVYGDTKDTIVPTDDGDVEVGWRFRLKSRGSLAWKMYQTEKSGRDVSVTPMDILGITAVVKDDEDQVKLFHALGKGIYSSDKIQPYAAPTKASAVHVRGMDDFIKNMIRDIPVNVPVDVKESSSPEAMHYGKITGFYSNLPFEVQCVTRFYRDSMQIGPLAHILYKEKKVGKMGVEETEKATAILAKIRSRRNKLGDPKLVNSRSRRTPAFNGNATMARELIERLVMLKNVTNRTVGFIALEDSKDKLE